MTDSDIKHVRKTIAQAKRLIQTYEVTKRNFTMCDSLEDYIRHFEQELEDRADADHPNQFKHHTLGILDGGNEIIWEWLTELVDMIQENKYYFLKLKKKKKDNPLWYVDN